MNTKLFFKASILAASLAAASAYAAPVVTVGGTTIAGEGQTTSIAGVSIIDFNVGSVMPADVTVTYAPGAANLVTGSAYGVTAAPPGDDSQYLVVSPISGTPVTFTIAGGADYIGFYAGSLDGFNTITFSGAGFSTTYTGQDLADLAGVSATGDQGIGRYFNVFESGNAFTTVTLTSTSVAFELDNFAIGRSKEVPLPGSLALLGLGAFAMGAARRFKK